jgi:integrase
MARATLTAKFVETITVKARTDFWDKGTPGFGLRVTPSGAKTWACFYRHNGAPRKYTISPYTKLSLKEARQEAVKVLRDAALHLDPANVKKAARAAGAAAAGATTFGDIAQRYLEGYAKDRKRTWREDERMIDGDLAVWKDRPAREIGRTDVAKVVDAIVARGSKISANRTLALLSKIFNLALGRGDVEVNPTYKFPRPGQERKSERALTDAEVKTLWNSLADQPLRKAAFFKLALLTGQRSREVLGMAKDEIDFEEALWTIPGTRTKNKKPHEVPLCDQAMALIESLKRDDCPFFFPARRVAPKPQRTYAHWVEEVRIATGMTAPIGDPAHFTEHALRHTLITGLAALNNGKKVEPFIIGRVVNHSEVGITARYDHHDYRDEKREALARWDARLAQIVA